MRSFGVPTRFAPAIVAIIMTIAAPARGQDAARLEQALHDLKQGKDVAANVALLRSAIEKARNPGALAMQVGTQLFTESLFAQAQGFLEIARARMPQDGTVALTLGKVHTALFHYEQGVEQLTAAEKLLPPGLHPVLHEYLSKVLVGMQRADEAEARAKRAIDEAKQWNAAPPPGKEKLELVRFDLNLATVYKLTMQLEKALAVLDQLDPAKLTPHDRAQAAVLRAQILDSKDDEKGALAAFEESRQAAPEDAANLYEYALFHVRRNQQELARPLLEAVVRIDPEHEGGHFNLGRVLLRLGEKEASAKVMEKYQKIHDARMEADRRLTELRNSLMQRAGDARR